MRIFNKFLLFSFCFFFLTLGFSQEKKRLRLKDFKISNLDVRVDENSSLAFMNGKLLTLNDSDNSSDLFEINPDDGSAIRFKTNMKNIDWEAICHDSVNLYVGDFGNNIGQRKDLKIYKIPYDSLSQEKEAKFASEIHFYYPEQKEYSSKMGENNFDAESMIFYYGAIHVFTKEWKDKMITHYEISLDSGDEKIPAKKIETYYLKYLATDVSFYQGKLYVVGYDKKGFTYLTIFQESDGGLFFEKENTRYFLGTAFSLGQIEGIEATEKGLFVSGERFHHFFWNIPTSLYFIPYDKLK